MFEAVNNRALNIPGGANVKPPQAVVPLQIVEMKGEKPTSDNVSLNEKAAQAKQRAAAEERLAEDQQAEKNRQVTEDMLKDLEQDIQTMHNVGLTFSKHNDTGRTVIKVMDKENNELIREIPSEEVLNLAAKIEEMIGILFDKEV